MLPLEFRSRAEEGRYGVPSWDKRLSDFSRWRIGGSCALAVEPLDAAQVASLIRDASYWGVPYFVIGAGSNIFFDDARFDGVCMRVSTRFAKIQVEDTLLKALSGIWAPHLARAACTSGLTGFEHIVGIPGSLGGLITMNGGSQRRGISEFLVRVTSIDPAGQMIVRDREQCEFSYRHSVFRANREVVLEAQFALEHGDPRTIRRTMLETLRTRRKKFPLKQPNCGSVFVSDPAMYSDLGPPGQIIEKLGYKGFAVGGAMVSTRHANFFVNTGDATAEQMLTLISTVRDAVESRTGYRLRSEVIFVDELGQMRPADEAG